MLSEKVVKKTKISISLTSVYVDALDQLVEAGVFASRTEIIKDGMRRIFRIYELKPFGKPL